MTNVGWLDKEKIELLKNNFSYVAVVILSVVILKLYDKNDKLQVTIDDLRERQYKHALDDVQIFQRAFEFINPVRGMPIPDTIYIPSNKSESHK